MKTVATHHVNADQHQLTVVQLLGRSRELNTPHAQHYTQRAGCLSVVLLQQYFVIKTNRGRGVVLTLHPVKRMTPFPHPSLPHRCEGHT